MLLNPSKYGTFKEFALSRVKQLYIPYVVFYLIIYLYWLFVERPLRSIWVSRVDALLGLFWGSDNNYWIFPAGVLWFVICLFSLELLFFAVIKVAKSSMMQVVILVLLTFVGILLARKDLYILPWSLNNGLISIPFFGVGYMLREKMLFDESFRRDKKKIAAYFFVPLLVFTIKAFPWLCNLGKQTDISYLNFPSVYIFYTIPFLEILLWVFVAMLIDHSKFLEFLGRNTLPILAFHPHISRICRYTASHVWGLSKAEIKGDLFNSICLLIVVLALCMPLIYLWNKVYPRIIGLLFKRYYCDQIVSNR